MQFKGKSKNGTRTHYRVKREVPQGQAKVAPYPTAFSVTLLISPPLFYVPDLKELKIKKESQTSIFCPAA